MSDISRRLRGSSFSVGFGVGAHHDRDRRERQYAANRADVNWAAGYHAGRLAVEEHTRAYLRDLEAFDDEQSGGAA